MRYAFALGGGSHRGPKPALPDVTIESNETSLFNPAVVDHFHISDFRL
jgi:hypothetical protein